MQGQAVSRSRRSEYILVLALDKAPPPRVFTMQVAINERWTRQPKFWEGHEDGLALRRFKEYEKVDGQAYDRGYEVGMNERRAKTRLIPILVD
jgi:hypothetical protein